MAISNCIYCGKEITQPSTGAPRRYCNDKCSYLYNTKEKLCKHCGKPFSATKGTKYCSKECKSFAYHTDTKKCAYCNTIYIGRKNSKYCSDECLTKSNLKTKAQSKKCIICNNSFSRLKYSNYSICSDECYNALPGYVANNLLKEVFGTDNVSLIKERMKNNE